jgi:CheY-like chemotaxis protein
MEGEKIKKRILIAEDDEMLMEIYKKKFEGSEYDLSFAENGQEALELIKKAKPKVVLLDLVMPEIDGFKVLEKIKEDSKIQDVNIIIVSNLSQETERERALKLGAKDFLIKSDHSPNELADKIKNYFE